MTAESRFSLTGRVALVTGAASGLGRAIAAGFAEAGARVRCVDRDAEGNDDVARSIGEPADSVTADVTDAEAVADAVDGLVAEAGRIDVLVNSAGVGGRSPAVDYPDDLWRSVIDINLRGTYLACRAAGRHMVAAGSGSIINIASVGGLAGFPGSLGYQASKGGVVALTRTLAIEWAPQGVRVNAIAPSQFESAIVLAQWEREPAMRADWESRTPLGRIGQPDEIVGPAVFLASDAAAMVTGHILAVDGGYLAQ
ncbi:MAG: SDR family oxidoreductase [Acidimicrobiia bacterium]|nr:SDR family oxidoreductase [Acidimicrobiia bacterium]